ncbi:MAG: DUF4159 domain-containing protein [Phycisphaerae bacterium]
MTRAVLLAGLVGVLWSVAGGPEAEAGKPPKVTDEAVRKAIQRGIDYLIKKQKGDGTWEDKQYHHANEACGHSELALLTLIYTGEHPNREYVSKALNVVAQRPITFTYAVAIRVMALAHVQNKLIEQKRNVVRAALKRDVRWLVASQGRHGGWGYTAVQGSKPSTRYEDFSVTQLVVLALREAALAGIEIPRSTWQRVQNRYFGAQHRDGSWSYIDLNDAEGYGSMTAAGLATIFITLDNLDAASGCPCRNGRSGRHDPEIDRRIDAALAWLEKHFQATKNPNGKSRREKRVHYWQYSVERVGMAAGYKYFGGHDWFKEIAAHLIRTQNKDGSWDGKYGKLVSTCFSVMFLYKGRGPILFNKLEFDGRWNTHRRDIYNLVTYISRIKEQLCHWQIVNLKAPLEELHDAPVLFITPESIPEFSDAHKQKLRRFTDTGGTILLEASCGNPQVKAWARGFIEEVWPEWDLKPLGPEHPAYTDPYPLRQRPEILGVDDGVRTFLFYAPDDISCPWHMRALAGRLYLFNWGINLVAHATDSAPLRAKLAERQPAPDERYEKQTVRAGAKKRLRLARVRHAGKWNVGANYRPLEGLAAYVKQKADLALEVKQGVAPRDLEGFDVAYVTGSEAAAFTPGHVEALTAFAKQGGWLWFEAATGSFEFTKAFRKAAAEAGWRVTLLASGHPMASGRMGGPKGFDLTQNVQFRRALKVPRTGRAHADFQGIYMDNRLVGVFSPIDVVFSSTPYEACMCQGYASPDARAVATNILLYAASERPER